MQRRGEFLGREQEQRREKMKAILGFQSLEKGLELSVFGRDVALASSFKRTGKLSPLQIVLAGLDGVEEDRDVDGMMQL